VGNVLNSVNVSASLMLEQLLTSNSRFLARAAKLLSEHKDDAGDFLKNDPKGKQLPAFFEAAADDLIREQSLLAQETENLRHNVEHLKQIVAQQQFRPSTLDIDESLALPDVVEDALRMVSSSLDRHEIEIVRQFESVPPVLADRHKVFQILVDLINNAKQALKDRADGRRLHLRIVRGQTDRVRVEVIDNGAGIRAENLVRIFKYNTATKDAGYCGLHSGANAAREMGGSLSVVSDGPGTGSTFILELPDH
jgi:C4-dicarboxylate-specific signal transduction histidine kinase